MDRIIRAAQQLLKVAVANRDSPLHDIKRVIYGDPVTIPESSLPVLTISPVITDYNARGNKLDQKTHRIEIRVIYNARTFFQKDTANDVQDKVYAVENMIQKMEVVETGLSTAVYSVAGVIESNPSLPLSENGASNATASIARVVSVSYEGLKNARGFHTYESVLTAEVIAVGDRS